MDRSSLDDDMYEEAVQLTREDLEKFNESLQRMISGDTTLVDQLSAIQLVCYDCINKSIENIFEYHRIIFIDICSQL